MRNKREVLKQPTNGTENGRCASVVGCKCRLCAAQATLAVQQAAFSSSVEEKDARAVELLQQVERQRRDHWKEKGDAVRVHPMFTPHVEQNKSAQLVFSASSVRFLTGS
jgi:hypothetical protein